jgi:hypothetical protein
VHKAIFLLLCLDEGNVVWKPSRRSANIMSLFLVKCVVMLILCSCFGNVNQLVPNRRTQLEAIRQARSNDPVDTNLLTSKLWSPDWYIAAIAADAIAESQKSRRLDATNRAMVLASLERSLARPQQWWRLGWDNNDSALFRGAIAYGLAQFGSEAIPTLARMLSGKVPQQYEDGCYIIVAMLDDQIVKADEINNEIRHQVDVLADTSEDDDVRNACRRAQALYK